MWLPLYVAVGMGNAERVAVPEGGTSLMYLLHADLCALNPCFCGPGGKLAWAEAN